MCFFCGVIICCEVNKKESRDNTLKWKENLIKVQSMIFYQYSYNHKFLYKFF